MKNLLFLAFAAMTLVFTKSCNDDDQEMFSVDLTFTPLFDGEPLVMYAEEYDYEEGMKLRLQLFQFFISNFRFIDDQGNEQPTPLEIDLISFADIQNRGAAEAGITVKVDNIPKGNYRSIKFGFGVDELHNATQPGDYDAGHPLSGHYWSAASSYVFTKIEGNADLNNDGQFEQKLTFHIGGNRSYQEIVLDKDLLLTSGSGTAVGIEVDLKDLLVNEQGEFLDFREVTKVHDVGSKVVDFVSGNIKNAFKIK